MQSREYEVAYFVLVGETTLGYCQTKEEAIQWRKELLSGIFKGKSEDVLIVEEQVELGFYDDY